MESYLSRSFQGLEKLHPSFQEKNKFEMETFHSRSCSNVISSGESGDFESVKKELKEFQISNDHRFLRFSHDSEHCDCHWCETFQYFEENSIPFSVPCENSAWFEAWNSHKRRRTDCSVSEK